MRFAALTYANTDNPRGFPDDYPAQTYLLRDGESAKSPWVEMSEDQLAELKRSFSTEVASVEKAARDADKDAENTKLDALKRQFDRLETLENGWDSATNQQKFDGLLDVIKILTRQRRSILDQYRPE